jgi:hypothetical protein
MRAERDQPLRIALKDAGGHLDRVLEAFIVYLTVATSASNCSLRTKWIRNSRTSRTRFTSLRPVWAYFAAVIVRCPLLGVKQTSSGRWLMSPFDPGCVKTQTLNLRVEFLPRLRCSGNQLHQQHLLEECD